ncbi:hypothetical protein N5852_13635 (plasmid) [Bartonella sp. HY328]|nr:hypothetical protein [Bartonella sp. HY328]UXN10897.1 hypothetical protein N5852_13635 [Bartonella sp. HY328]
MKKALSIFLIFFLFTLPAAASDWQNSEKAQIQSEFTAFNERAKTKDLNMIQDALPPAFMKYLADKDGQDVETLKASMTKAMEMSFANIKTIEGSFNPDDILYRQSSDGAKYAIIPYKTHIVLTSGQEVTADSKVAAIMVEGKYWFLDVGKEINVMVIKTVYPEYKDLDVSVN